MAELVDEKLWYCWRDISPALLNCFFKYTVLNINARPENFLSVWHELHDICRLGQSVISPPSLSCGGIQQMG